MICYLNNSAIGKCILGLCIFFISNCYLLADIAIDNCLVGHWIYENTDSGIVEDVSGNNNHGSLFFDAKVSSLDLPFANSLEFGLIDVESITDETSYLSVPSFAGFNLSQGFTFSSWIKFSELLPFSPIFSKITGFEKAESGFVFFVNENYQFSCVGADDVITLSDSQIQSNVWMHLSYSYDGNQSVLYVNGDRIASSEHDIWDSNSSLSIGSLIGDSTIIQLVGSVADTRFYSIPLSATEIKSQFQTSINLAGSDFSLLSPFVPSNKNKALSSSIGGKAGSMISSTNLSSKSPPLPSAIPTVGDSDGDGLPDAWEILYSLNPNNPADAPIDSDGDGDSNTREFILGKDPRVGSQVSQDILSISTKLE